LAAVFIVVKKMDPSAQIRRMREQQTGGSSLGGSADSAALTEELHKLRGEVDQKKHIP
jgi:hypothetical protein